MSPSKKKKKIEILMKKWKNRKDFNFLHLCLVGSGWKGGKSGEMKFFFD